MKRVIYMVVFSLLVTMLPMRAAGTQLEIPAKSALLMDKFTFEGVDHSWTKLCYYYKHFSPECPI